MYISIFKLLYWHQLSINNSFHNQLITGFYQYSILLGAKVQLDLWTRMLNSKIHILVSKYVLDLVRS